MRNSHKNIIENDSEPVFLQDTWTLIPRPKKKELWKFHTVKYCYLYYRDRRVDLASGVTTSFSIAEIKEHLNSINIIDNAFPDPIVFHFFYELGEVILFEKENVPLDSPLLLEIHYSDMTIFPMIEMTQEREKRDGLKLINGPTFAEYEQVFDQGYEELLSGNCYQFNLTYPFHFKFTDSIEDFCSHLWQKSSCGAYAHATSIPSLNKIFISNSPESLFRLSEVNEDKSSYTLETRPIKGSMPWGKGSGKSQKIALEELKNSRKNESELFMITDLLRNDLSKIEKPTAKVITAKKGLVVPGLVHTYSLIQVELSRLIGLGDIIWALFPGGSITGAPKKRVTQILKKLEQRERGFYTGSTLILYRNMCEASINIRSATCFMDRKILEYGAGGGITLKARAEEEYLEMINKVKSFMGEGFDE